MSQPIYRTLSSLSPEKCMQLVYRRKSAQWEEGRKIDEEIESVKVRASPLMMAWIWDFALNEAGTHMEIVPYIEDLVMFPTEQVKLAIRLGRIPDDEHDFMFHVATWRMLTLSKWLVYDCLEKGDKDRFIEEVGDEYIGVGTLYHPELWKYMELWNTSLLKIFQPHKFRW